MHASGGPVLHWLVLVVWVPALLVWLSLDRAWRRGRDRLLLGVAGIAGLTYVAGLVHLVVLPEHARQSVPFGVFFAVAATAQLAYPAVLARRPTTRLIELGVIGQLGLVLVWAFTRVVGPPIGPEPWRPEPVGFLDAICVASEAGAVLLALWLLGPAGSRLLRGAPDQGTRKRVAARRRAPAS